MNGVENVLFTFTSFPNFSPIPRKNGKNQNGSKIRETEKWKLFTNFSTCLAIWSIFGLGRFSDFRFLISGTKDN